MPDKENFVPNIPGVESAGPNIKKYKIPILIGVVILILGVIGFFAYSFFSADPEPEQLQPVTLEFWDTYDSRAVYQPLIDRYESENPHVTIEYKSKNPDTSFQKPEEAFHEEVTDALAAGEGPDIYTIQNTWVPMEKGRLVSLNNVRTDINPAVLINKYPDVVRFDLIKAERVGVDPSSRETEEHLYGLPLSIDTLALYYNKDHFAEAGISTPPSTWEEFVDAVKRLRIIDGENVIRAGAALGASDTHTVIEGGDNVGNAVDILSLMMLQSGTRMNDYNSGYVTFDQAVTTEDGKFYPGREALQFYTSFADKDSENYTWDPDGPYSLDAFTQRTASMMINYQEHVDVIEKKNPYLNFDIASIPQPKDNLSYESYASYWALAVSSSSKQPEEAWNFILWLTEEENNAEYLENSGRPPALRSDVAEFQQDSNLGVFARQILTARSWLQPNPFETEKIMESFIKEVVLEDAVISNVINRMTSRINSLWIREDNLF
ncbi:MAG: extracellular solute-binding protein [Candidatus Spechtbacterales bacterium]|nr:extracellular solute-binding protein [Candidatus Spechtbacterales bacterium]